MQARVHMHDYDLYFFAPERHHLSIGVGRNIVYRKRGNRSLDSRL